MYFPAVDKQLQQVSTEYECVPLPSSAMYADRECLSAQLTKMSACEGERKGLTANANLEHVMYVNDTTSLKKWQA